MTTTAAGDAAVARLNKATEAFEKIITGASNQVVDVPGYGNQPTLAARVDERLDEITATAAAEANRSRDEADRATNQANAAANSVTLANAEFNKAKTQADRAQSEADRAAQITGLETVADAIGMAALPLPDVWAPLSDSLRLITGYGRDVLVGSDVVARMVNFSRSTTKTYWGKDGQFKVAAANEPAFELEGLLLEGQSTNVFNKVSGSGFSWVSSWLTTSTGTVALPFDVFQRTVTSSTSTPASTDRSLVDIYSMPNPAAALGGPVTISAIMFGNADEIIAADPKFNISSNLTITGSVQSVIKMSHDTVRVVWTGIITAGSATAFANFQLSWLNRIPSVVVGCYQIEALPFASSYIPTNGTAVTRAADKAWLNAAGNLVPLSVIALDFNSIAPPSFYQTPNLTRYIVHTGDGTGITAYLGRFTTQFEDAGAAQGSTISPGRTVVVGGVSGGKATIRSGAGLAAGVAVKGFKRAEIYLCNSGTGPADRQVYGHVRNLRMYHCDLTADQYKAVA